MLCLIGFSKSGPMYKLYIVKMLIGRRLCQRLMDQELNIPSLTDCKSFIYKWLIAGSQLKTID